MNIQIFKYLIYPNIAKNPLYLFIFIFSRIFLHFLKSQIYIFPVIILLSWTIFYFTKSIIGFLLAFFYFLVYPFISSVEEFVHIAVCIKKNCLCSIELWITEKTFLSILKIIRVSIRFKGIFSNRDILHINIVGPITNLLCWFLLILLVFVYGKIYNHRFHFSIIRFLLFLLFLQLKALRKSTDINNIIKCFKKMNLFSFSKIHNIIYEILYSYMLVFLYLMPKKLTNSIRIKIYE
jgi:hypothetical protein